MTPKMQHEGRREREGVLYLQKKIGYRSYWTAPSDGKGMSTPPPCWPPQMIVEGS